MQWQRADKYLSILQTTYHNNVLFVLVEPKGVYFYKNTLKSIKNENYLQKM